METIKRWEEGTGGESLGILRMAGWRIGADAAVTSISTGRQRRGQMTWVYGDMELADSGSLLWGRMGLAEEECCVVSEELARNLFGCVDVVGEQVKAEGKIWTVAGVVDKDGEALMVSATEGSIEYLSVEFDRRMEAEGKMKRLMEEY